MEHAYLTQENIIRALVQHAITELEANKLLKLLFTMTQKTTKR